MYISSLFMGSVLITEIRSLSLLIFLDLLGLLILELVIGSCWSRLWLEITIWIRVVWMMDFWYTLK